MIAGVVLAAGRSTRFGGDKLTTTLGTRAVVHWSVAAVLGGVSRAWVVVSPDAVGVRDALSGLPVDYVDNVERDEGMASSIRAGVAAMTDEVAAVVIALGDQPLVASEVVAKLCARWRVGDVAAVVTEYSDGRGHPVLFGRETFDALARLRGDIGARAVLADLRERVGVVIVPSAAPIDVDTPGAMERVRVQAALLPTP